MPAISKKYVIDEACLIGHYFSMTVNDYSKMSLNDLEKRAEVLKHLCHHLDPYSPLSQGELKQLEEVGIETTEDPFHLTNILILYVEDTLEEISRRRKVH